MFDILNTSVIDAEDSDLESAFPSNDGDKNKDKGKKTPPATGKEKVQPKTTTSKSTDKPALGAFGKSTPISELSEDEDDDLFGSPAKDNDEEKPEEEEEQQEEEEEEEKPEGEEEEEEEEKQEGDDDDADTKDFLKARANLLIKKGEWADFEGSEDYEWDEDSFADMEIQQREYQRGLMREDLLNSFGPYGREIAEYAAKGGDPDKLIDIFKEQSRVEALSIETEDQQRAVVMKYETEFLKKKPERVKNYIDSLIASKELENEAKEAKAAMDQALKDEADSLQAEADATIAQNAARQKQAIQKFQTDITSLVNKSDDIPADEKKQLLAVLTKFDKKLKNGNEVNEFYFKFEQFRKDLPNYVKLVRFVLNPEKFIKSIENNGKTSATTKAFSLARTANRAKKTKAVDENSGRSGKSVGTKFKLL